MRALFLGQPSTRLNRAALRNMTTLAALYEQMEIKKHELWWSQFELAEKIMVERPDIIVVPYYGYLLVLAKYFSATTDARKITKTLAEYASAMELLSRVDNMEIFEKMYRERCAWVGLMLYKYGQYKYWDARVRSPAELRDVIVERLNINVHYAPVRECIGMRVVIERLRALCDYMTLTNKQRRVLGTVAAAKAAHEAIFALLPQPIAEEVAPHMTEHRSVFD